MTDSLQKPPPHGDPQQESAWIAFSRFEWYTNISDAFPNLSQQLGYSSDGEFLAVFKPS